MKLPHPNFTIEERIAMGAQCRDCDPVPKVAEAGMVFHHASGQRVQIMHNGLRVVADGYGGPWTTDLIRLCQGHHEPQEERIFHEVLAHLPDSARMIELGGYWSYYSLWFLQDRPDRRAAVLEPEPHHLQIGRTNAALNNLRPDFYHGFAGKTYARSAPFRGETSGDMVLRRYSVESLMAKQRWRRLDLLHCDIQGAELEVLESCRDMFLQRRIDWVFVSTHTHLISGDPLTHQRCLDLLRGCGAIIEAEHDVHESYSGDGLIVARFCPAPRGWASVPISHNRHGRSLFRSLAYDLDEAHRKIAALTAAGAKGQHLHPDLRHRGSLLELAADGPLGKAGDTLIMPDDAVMSPAVHHNAAWDPQNVDLFAAHMDGAKSYTLLDIGANVGLFSRQLGNKMPNVERFICVEPDQNNFRALRYNLSALADRVKFCNVALAAEDGATEIFQDRENIGNYSLNPDAMRGRPYVTAPIQMRETRAWMLETVGTDEPLLWKSDTQGYDEAIIAATPMDIWQRIDVALIEIWRIAKPPFDPAELRARLACFPNRQLGDEMNVSVEQIMEYLSADDWQFKDLLMWK